MKNLFFVDAETDGLYGSFLTIGIIVTNWQGEELERNYYGIDRKALRVTDDWVKEHVVGKLGDYEKCQSEKELLDKLWECWSRYASHAYAVVDVAYPVECRLFQQCVLQDRENRQMKGPYPLLDISSLLMGRGLDPLIERKKLVKDMAGMGRDEQHNALFDVEVSVNIWKKYFADIQYSELEAE